MNITAQSFPEARSALRLLMKNHGKPVHTETWQGVDVRGRADALTYELLNVTVRIPLERNESLDYWRLQVTPNLPWANDHFAERVSGQPLNPPPSWAWWPWAKSAAKHRDPAAKFNHTYPERYWAKFAGLDLKNHAVDCDFYNHTGSCDCGVLSTPRRGIRGEYGDLNDVVQLLVEQPSTRQAYLPIFFPEDTGIGDGGRKPCTLGYQFIVRENALHCFYPMRSCDLIRHFADDVYLTIRLMIWVLEAVRSRTGIGKPAISPWDAVHPGTLTMHMTSLHIFENDKRAL